MKWILICALAAIVPCAASAGERIAGTNSYIVKEDRWPIDYGTYWRQDNGGTFSVTEGPLEDGFVQCIGAGFGTAGGSRGEGICVFTTGDFAQSIDTFTWEWTIVSTAQNAWKVIGATGKYAGMRGSGTARTRIGSEFRAKRFRITDWEGEIEMPPFRD
ncbi:hypothetical protein [Maritimibacter sp. UBA3975]|uniref:hypothetical protein n=1 Tax=Maritimibacter sp. UBA3975 TaxID=1946833 RepID=UPI000C0B0BAC|nr:hypothetical protein [Maritimibacter sp. UBA3975]MAM63052.1 hypothetical protein [Maritimibacter sp.]|tara:strand:+ start:15578 stop:16054 length:477 start_codon:yes stop_codon:yes gene_type:complete